MKATPHFSEVVHTLGVTTEKALAALLAVVRQLPSHLALDWYRRLQRGASFL